MRKILRKTRHKLFLAAAISISLVLIGVTLMPNRTYAVTDTFNATSTWQAPTGVTSVTVQAWGGGGAGGAATGNPSTGGGGAGGTYVSKDVTVSPGTTYTVTVGTGGTGGAGSGGVGNDSWFSTSGTVIAKGGAGGTAGTVNSTNGAGATGSCTGCIGTSFFAGGNGGTGNFTSGVQGSGAGGGAAGTTGAGGNASVNTAGTGTSGGGNGAAGVGNSTVGAVGSIPGGGGSGGKANTNADRNGGSGATGRILLTYTIPNQSPAAPTLSTPVSGVTGVSLTPQFTLRTTDADNDYLRYKIILYQSDCSTVVSTIDQTSSQTGWSGQDTQTATAYIGNSTIASSTMATYTYQTALSANTTYCWKGQAIDPAGTNVFGSFSTTRTFTTNASPAAPVLSAPLDAATSVSTTPAFSFRSTDGENDYLRYKIDLCTTSNCSNILRTIDQTSSQTGWTGQDSQLNTAYVGSSVITSSTLATHTYQSPALSQSTQYWWRAYAIDTGGTNIFSGASTIQSFMTESPPPPSTSSDTYLQGGTIIRGGTRISN